MSSSANPPTSDKSFYKLTLLLLDHQGLVSCISVNTDGTLVACGGYDGTSLWNLTTGQKIQIPTKSGDQGLTTAVVWITRPDDADDAVVSGMDKGYLYVWKKSRDVNQFTEVTCVLLEGDNDGKEISGIAYDPSSSQLAVVHRAKRVHRFLIDGSFTPIPMKSVEIERHWPAAVAFGFTTVKGPEIWTFGREDGGIHVLDDDGKIISTTPTGSVIGHAMLSVMDDIFIFDDVSQGIAIYKLSTRDRIKTLEVPSTTRRLRNVALHDHRTAVVSGSDHGSVYIFDRRTGDLRDILRTGMIDWVQCVATAETEYAVNIIVGRSDANVVGSNPLQVWTKVIPSEQWRERQSATMVETICWISCILLALLFILQNVSSVPVMSRLNMMLGYVLQMYQVRPHA